MEFIEAMWGLYLKKYFHTTKAVQNGIDYFGKKQFPMAKNIQA